MDKQRQVDRLEPLYNSSMPIQEDLPGAIDDRDGWRERIREIRTGSATG